MTQPPSSWYPIFGIPHTILANIDYTHDIAVIKFVYIDKYDLNIFSHYVSVHSTGTPFCILILQLQQ